MRNYVESAIRMLDESQPAIAANILRAALKTVSASQTTDENVDPFERAINIDEEAAKVEAQRAEVCDVGEEYLIIHKNKPTTVAKMLKSFQKRDLPILRDRKNINAYIGGCLNKQKERFHRNGKTGEWYLSDEHYAKCRR